MVSTSACGFLWPSSLIDVGPKATARYRLTVDESDQMGMSGADHEGLQQLGLSPGDARASLYEELAGE